MLFPTVEFALFFLVVFLVGWAIHRFDGARKLFFIAASYFFYGMWNPKFTLLLFFCSAFNFAVGTRLSAAASPGRKKAWLILSVVTNLGILGFFKYSLFFTQTVNNLFLAGGSAFLLPMIEVVLPVGISFFTFQAMSYVIDVYRGEIERASFVDVLLYISFFPQLVAGPIVRASDFIPQLRGRPDPGAIEAAPALRRILFGLVKKVVIANYLAVELVDPVFLSPSSYSSLTVLLAGYGYAVQIFCDFSAYSDIAIGAAALLGYRFPENFNQPYRADSLQDFWRRWHISLSSWLRDYLYIPLGGSRKGSRRTYLNLLVTMLLGGLWHGAGWNFLLWGALHGGYQAVERKIRSLRKGKPAVRWWKTALKRLWIFHFVCFCWIFFRSPTMAVAGEYFRALVPFSLGGSMVSPFLILLLLAGMLLHYIPRRLPEALARGFARFPLVLQGLTVGGFLLVLAALSPEGVAPFIYFQF